MGKGVRFYSTRVLEPGECPSKLPIPTEEKDVPPFCRLLR